MKIKTLFISILAATCLGISACNPKDAPKSSEEPVASSSIEELSSDEPIESSEDPVASSEEPVSSEEPISSEEPPHEHSFGDWTEVKAPTCTEKGKEERVCACGEKEERDVDALGHNPGEWEVTLEPTVDAEGQKVKKCTRCQEVLETEAIDKLEPPVNKLSQIVSFATSSGSGEHDADSLLALMKGDLVKAITNVSKIYKSTGTGGAHPNEDGIIKTGTSKANGTMTITCEKPITKLTIDCHDFYAKSDAYPTNSNKITINGVEQLTPYNVTGEKDTLTWEFAEAVETIEFSAARVYIWSMGFYE